MAEFTRPLTRDEFRKLIFSIPETPTREQMDAILRYILSQTQTSEESLYYLFITNHSGMIVKILDLLKNCKCCGRHQLNKCCTDSKINQFKDREHSDKCGVSDSRPYGAATFPLETSLKEQWTPGYGGIYGKDLICLCRQILRKILRELPNVKRVLKC